MCWDSIPSSKFERKVLTWSTVPTDLGQLSLKEARYRKIYRKLRAWIIVRNLFLFPLSFRVVPRGRTGARSLWLLKGSLHLKALRGVGGLDTRNKVETRPKQSSVVRYAPPPPRVPKGPEDRPASKVQNKDSTNLTICFIDVASTALLPRAVETSKVVVPRFCSLCNSTIGRSEVSSELMWFLAKLWGQARHKSAREHLLAPTHRKVPGRATGL